MERATAAAPELTGNPSSNLLKMLPIFGGAAGGLLYAGLTSSEAGGSARDPRWAGGTRARRGSSGLKRLFGFLLILGGGLFLVLAVVHACDTWNLARRQPTAASAVELCRPDYLRSAPDWIVYTFAEAKATEVTVTRQHLGLGGDVEARCLLIRVGDKWLTATVAPGFDGDHLVGRLVSLDSPASRALLARLRKQLPNGSVLLPYEFNAVDGNANDQRVRYMAAAWLAAFGFVGLWLGRYLFRGGRRPAPQSPALAAGDWTYQPLSGGRPS